MCIAATGVFNGTCIVLYKFCPLCWLCVLYWCVSANTHTHTHTLTHTQTFHHGFSSQPICLGYDSVQQLLAVGTEHGAVLLYPPI